MALEGKTGLERQIGVAVNELVTKMGSVVVKVKQAAEQVARSAAEISQGSVSLSEPGRRTRLFRCRKLRRRWGDTSTVRQNADNAREANQLALDARRRAENGNGVVANAIQAMAQINAASSNCGHHRRD